MAFHELAINAVNYGALSAPEGRVEVVWRTDWRGGKTPALEFLWREASGPPVRPPRRTGFGTRLIERGLGQELGAEVRLDYAATGLECQIRLPLSAKITVPPVAR